MMRLFCSGHHSVHPSSCTPSVLLPALSIPPSPPSICFRSLASATSPTLPYQILSGCRLASLVRDGGGGGDPVELLRWHLLPSWHQLRALRIFRASFPQVAVIPMTLPTMLSAPCGFHCTTSRVPSIQLHLRQASWDKPAITADSAIVLTATTDSHDRARLLASMAPYSGDWLHALPISSCGLRLDDEAIRVAVGLRLGINLCQPHQCPCGTLVDTRGTHGLACRRSSGRMARNHNINDLIYRGLIRAGVPSTKEPSGLSRTDGKRPDGLTLIPWQCGKSLIWDVTVADTLAASHLAATSVKAGSAADSAAVKKDAKYADLAGTYHFVPIASVRPWVP